jgi:outer membrane protein TolC
VQIQRLTPQSQKFNLDALSGAYDPNIGLNATHSYNKFPGGTGAGGFPIPANELTVNSVGPFIRGVLPFGLQYNGSVSVNQRDGTTIVPSANEYSTSASIQLTQPLLKNFSIDTTRHTILVSRKDLKKSEQDVVHQIISTVTSVQQAYYELIYARENVKVLEKSLELAQQLLSENKKRVEVGVLAPLDEKQAESQVASAKADVLTGRLGYETAQNTLKNLITDDFANWSKGALEPAEQMIALAEKLDLQESWRKGLTFRPDYTQARLEVEKQDIHIKYYNNQRYPQLDLVGSYGQNGLNGALGDGLWDIRPGGKSPNYSGGVVLSIPLGNRDAKNRYAAAKVDKQQALLRLKKLEQTIMVDIDGAVKQARIQYERIESTRAAREFAQAALEAERTKLANGKSTSFVVLQLQRDLTVAATAEIRALADYNKAIAALAQSEGSTLERNKLSVEMR